MLKTIQTLQRIDRYLETVNDDINEKYSKNLIEEILVEGVEGESTDEAYRQFMDAYERKDGKEHTIGTIKTQITRSSDGTAEMIPIDERFIYRFFRDLIICRNPKSCNDKFTPRGWGTPATIKFTNGNEFEGSLYVYFAFGPLRSDRLVCTISSTPIEYRSWPDK